MPLMYHVYFLTAIALVTLAALYGPRRLLFYVLLPISVVGFVLTQAALWYLLLA